MWRKYVKAEDRSGFIYGSEVGKNLRLERCLFRKNGNYISPELIFQMK